MPFEFIAGRVCLDFVATVDKRTTDAVELLDAPADLTAWLQEAGLLDRRVRVDDAGLRSARQLREALWAVLTAASEGEEPPRAARLAVNRAAGAEPPVPSLTPAGQLERRGDLTAALSAVARDAIDLVTGPDLADLRWCDDPACTRGFIDRSRGGRRRWCGMTGCGDRAKAAAYRARRRLAAAG